MRIGHGYDAHKLTSERRLILGGITIPHNKGLLGHSDADVLTHAIIDALLGASALGDIGTLFPDNSLKYKDISSLILLEEVHKLLSNKGFKICNIDSTILAQAPKLKDYIPSMRKNIASVLNIGIDKISIKATTEEGMGFTGRLEGISVHAVCIIE